MEMEDVSIEPEPVPGFPVYGLRGTPDSREVLKQVADRFRRMPENDGLYRGLFARFEFAHDPVATLDSQSKPKHQYCDDLVCFVKLLRRKSLLERLARSEKMISTIYNLHFRLDSIFESVGLGETPEMTQWKTEWAAGCADQCQKLTDLIQGTPGRPGATSRMLVNEIRGHKRVKEMLMDLSVELKGNQVSQLRPLKQATLDHILAYLQSQPNVPEFIPRLFDWYISKKDVTLAAEPFGNGTYGAVSRGTWCHNDVDQDVVVKTLYLEASDAAEGSFLDLLDFWSKLPPHPSILKLHGGCHLSTPPFFVCEEAFGGSIVDFLAKEENKSKFWPMFFHVAEGLQFLRDQKIVHGNLKGSNILVGDLNSVKLLDFGCSSIRTISAGLSQKSANAQNSAVRWKPKEILQEEEPRFESDIYSLGMCMIEALTVEAPFAEMLDDQEVIDFILRGGSHPRPDGLTDVAWTFISQLCAVNYGDRPNIDEAIQQIRQLLVEEHTIQLNSLDTKNKETTETFAATSCPECDSSAAVEDSFCRYCGYCVLVSVENAQPESIKLDTLTKYLREAHRGNEVWQKLFEVGLALQDLHGQRIFHGDLKPTNILVGRDGRTKLAGFKFSGKVDELAKYPVARLPASFRWQAPELLAGEKPSLASDVYALGMCFLHAVSGQPPWGLGITDEASKRLVLKQHFIPPRPEGFSDEQWDLITGMCLFPPDERLVVRDVVLQLGRFLATKPAPEWSIAGDEIDSNESEYCAGTRFVSRHSGMWGGSAVAIEKVRDAFATVKRSFQSVVEMWLALKHPNILQLFGGCSDEAGPFFVCEYAECGDLGKILRERGQEKRVWPKLLDVAFALRYLHARGIIHGDIRLQNILVCRDGKAKLAGFVLSSTKEQAANTHPEADQRTGCEWLKTTWSCGHHPSLTSDVYGLGQCILDAVNGDVVSIQHDEPMRCDICSNYSLPQQPATFSDDQWQLVSDMCCSNPQERITMAEVVYRLSRLVAVDTAIDADLKTLIELDSEQRNRVQAMVLKKVLEIEAEDEDDADTDNTCSADDDIRVATRKTLVNQQKVACRQTMDRFVADAAKEVIDGALEVMQQGMDVPTAETRWPKHAGIEKALMPVGGACFEWRIAPDRVEVAKNAGVLHGSVAKVQQGMWLGATVAVKKMKNVGPSDDQAFREEANIWYGLNHPHIVNLFGACTQGYQVFVSDFAEGGRLDYYLREGNNRVQVWGLLHEAALGLRWLHSRGVTHADLKCDNILVTADGRAKLADFGLSCVQECSGGKPVGALRWKAPECLRGSGPTFASDVYSFGMCILEAVSAKFPWGNKMADNVVSYRVGRGELPAKPTSGFDETRWQLVKRMCCPEPQNRLNLDFVVGALGLFANRSPCTEDAALRNELATWEEAR